MISDRILKSFEGKNVLVTGGTGLIGRQVVGLLSDVAHVKIVSLDDIKVHPSAEHVYGDLTDFSFCKEITAGMDFVFHLAGIKGSIDVTRSRPASFFVPLLMMNTSVLEACRLEKVQKVLYASSIGAYPSGEIFKESEDWGGEPMDMFPGWAKRMAEMQVQAYRIQYGLDNFAIVRPCNVYGPGDNFDPDNAMVIPSLMYRVYHGEDPLRVWGDGSAIRDFAYSDDVACGMVLALHHGTDSRPINLGSGRGCSIRELVKTLSGFIPFSYEFDTARSGGFPRRVMDISLARKKLGYEPATSLEVGLKKTWAWFTGHQDEHLSKKNYFKD
jgi:GDP-L-fucose synthase